jgi:hypothetical protein
MKKISFLSKFHVDWKLSIFLLGLIILPASTNIFLTVFVLSVIVFSIVLDLYNSHHILISVFFIYVLAQYYFLFLGFNLSNTSLLLSCSLVIVGFILKFKYSSSKTKMNGIYLQDRSIFKEVIGPLIATMLLIAPEVVSTAAEKLALQFDGYDNVVHYGVISKVIACDGLVTQCPGGTPTPLDSYPQNWHSLFGSFFMNYGDTVPHMMTLYVFAKVFTLFLSFGLVKYALRNHGFEEIARNSKFGILGKCLVYIGPISIFYFSGWPNYALSVSLLVFSYASFVNNRPLIGTWALSVCALFYTPFWPLVAVLGLLSLRSKPNWKKILNYFVTILFPCCAFLWTAYEARLERALIISNTTSWLTIIQLILLSVLFLTISIKRSSVDFIIRIYLFGILVIAIPYQLFSILTGSGGLYFLQKFLGAAPFFIYLGFLCIYSKIKRSNSLVSEAKILIYPIISFLLFYWSMPILVLQSPRALVPNEFIFAKLQEYQYGLKASPINSSIRNYYISFKPESPYSQSRVNRSRDVLRALENSKEYAYYVPTGLDPSYYHNTQWVNALKNSWTNEIQGVIDESVTSRIPIEDLDKFFESKNIKTKLRSKVK